MPRLALKGLRIIDLSQVYAGPYATRLLADMGAEVIKIESAFRSGRGGIKPQPGAVYPDGEPGERPYNRVAYYNELNRNKYAITLDLSPEPGKAIFKKLVKIGDVVIENFSARVMKNFGLDYPALKEVNPRIIMVSMTGYGMTGPYRDYVAYGTGIEAMTGLSQLTGYLDSPPMRLGVAYSDATGGLHAAFAILIALRYRRLTGRGQHIDLSLREALTPLLSEAIMDYSMNNRLRKRNGNRHSFMTPHGCYRCQGEDSWVVIAISSDEEWHSFCNAIGNPPWTKEERFRDMVSRWQSQEELDRLIAGWTRHHDHYEAMWLLQRAGVKAGAVLNIEEMLDDPHLKERGFFEMVTHPEAGTHLHPGMSWKLSKTPGWTRMPAPCFAEHNDYVFGKLLGMSQEEIAKLTAEGVIATVPIQ